MNGKRTKQIRKEIRKNANVIQTKILSEWLEMPLKYRFLLALKIIRGTKKGGKK